MDLNTHEKFLMVYALQQTDKQKAIEAISSPDLNPDDLSALLDYAFSAKVVDKKGNQIKLCKEVIQAGVLNKLKRMS